jgi:putative transposase
MSFSHHEEDGMPRGQEFPLEVMLRAIREVDNGVPVSVVCRNVGMVDKTFRRYREKYAAMEPMEARGLRELEEENARLNEASLRADAAQRGAHVRPAARCQAVQHLQTAYRLSERSSSRARGMPRATQR